VIEVASHEIYTYKLSIDVSSPNINPLSNIPKKTSSLSFWLATCHIHTRQLIVDTSAGTKRANTNQNKANKAEPWIQRLLEEFDGINLPAKLGTLHGVLTPEFNEKN
jgi:hypothetical protein